MQDGIHRTLGIFQQSDRWWGTPQEILDIPHATESFLNALRRTGISADPVRDCWEVQHWYPSNTYNPFSRETINYTRRLREVATLLTGVIP